MANKQHAQFSDENGNLFYLENQTEDVLDPSGKPLSDGGDLSEASVKFSVDTSRKLPQSGGRFKAFLGSIVKYLTDLGAAAYLAVANNDTTTQPGFVGDARVLKQHRDAINQLNSEMASMKTSFQAGVDTLYNKCSSCGATPSAKTPTAISTAIQKIYTDRYNAGLSAATLSKCEVLATASNQDQTSLSHTTSKAYKLVICCVGAGDQGKSLNGGHATASCAGFNAAVSKQFDDVQIGSTKVAFGSHVFYLFNVPSGKKINLNWSYRGIGTIIGFN